MKATPKADECIKMIEEIELIGFQFSAFNNSTLTDEEIQLCKDNNIEIFQLEREQFDGLVYWTDYYSTILQYRLLPMAYLKWKNNSSFKHITDEAEKNECLSILSKHTKTKPSILWQVLINHDEVTLDDLKKEFWEIIPDLNSIEEYYQVMKMKFAKVYSEIPEKSYYNYFNLIKDNDFMANFNVLIQYEVVEKKEIETLIFKLEKVIEWLNLACLQILEMYKSFLPNNLEESTESVMIPEEFNEDALLNEMRFNPRIQKYYGKDDYKKDYLNDIYKEFNPQTQNNHLGGVCYLLHREKIFKTKNFSDLLILLSNYWNIPLPKEKRPNKYKAKAEELEFLHPNIITPY